MDIPVSLRGIVTAAEACRQEKGRAIVAFDGMSAAGKTTAAAVLARLWNAPVVHMDDFFLPAELRTPDRLAEPGGNVHYERFAREVLQGLATESAFAYRRFSCSVMDYDGTVEISAAPVILVEGAYALHPRFGSYADVTAYFAVTPTLQRERILTRSGAAAWERFRDRWIPMEEAYDAAFGVRAKAKHLVMDFCENL